MLMETLEIWSFLDADQLDEAARAAGKLPAKGLTPAAVNARDAVCLPIPTPILFNEGVSLW